MLRHLEIHVTRLRAESPQAFSVSVDNHWCETETVLMASGCVMQRPLECFIFRQVLC